jgi:hypothetical protein
MAGVHKIQTQSHYSIVDFHVSGAKARKCIKAVGCLRGRTSNTYTEYTQYAHACWRHPSRTDNENS